MALIKCRECGKEISDSVKACIHCGCPLSKVKFSTTNDFIGLVGKYTIYDSDENILVKLKRGEEYETVIDKDTKFFVQCNTTFSRKKVEVIASASKNNNFVIGNNGGASTSVLEIE